ncbi:hypothetical protein [Streptomyces violens]|uniref:hypothetical protein n=1 Tax=Streptomyces violens TaxID=66377 RepID=UPI0006900BC3|nr:hypothetical protein [Streptomyces violens]
MTGANGESGAHGHGGGSHKDIAVSEKSRKLISEGLRSAIDELKEVGFASQAAMGAGVDRMTLTGMEAGHPGLADDFEDFCGRWEWGVRGLLQDVTMLAASMGMATGLLTAEDEYLQGSFKVAANQVVGNPYASDEDVRKKGWGEIATKEMYTPDYSDKKFGQSMDQAEQVWKDTGRQVVTTGHGGMITDRVLDDSGLDRDAWNEQLDETFGPAPEAGDASGTHSQSRPEREH